MVKEVEGRKKVWVTPSPTGKQLEIGSSEPGDVEVLPFSDGVAKIGGMLRDGHAYVGVFTEEVNPSDKARVLKELRSAVEEAAKGAGKKVRFQQLEPTNR